MTDPPNPSDEFTPQEMMIIRDPEAIAVMFHKERGLILQQLISKKMTLRELAETLKINPGTVKRHLTDLEHIGVIISPDIIQEEGVNKKYYRAAAKNFRCDLIFPADFSETSDKNIKP